MKALVFRKTNCRKWKLAVAADECKRKNGREKGVGFSTCGRITKNGRLVGVRMQVSARTRRE